jgi:glycosyltransferase involved in cell wall biosynthesis
MRDRILIMIPFEVRIGFAIGRYIGVFYEMGQRLTTSPDDVHFAFSKVGADRSPSLPRDFENLVEFDMFEPSPDQVAGLVRYVREQEITVIFGLDLPVNARYLSAVRQSGVRKVISYWGAPMSAANSGLKLAAKRLEVALVWRAKPDHFIFESNAMRDLGVRGRGLLASRTSVIRTGVDEQLFRPSAAGSDIVYDRFSIPKDRRIIVYMGHLNRRKGVHVLLEAAVLTTRDMHRADIHYLFLGDRPGEADGFRADFDIASSHVTFGGYQSEIPRLLSGCFAGCIPSDGWDSFPMSSLEMQACGLPVIASDCQGVPETISDGETGIVVPAGNAPRLAEAIAALADNKDLRDAMGRAARARIEAGFTRNHQIENLVRRIRVELEK